jgi:squalene-associated FAD-dependent desaturase
LADLVHTDVAIIGAGCAGLAAAVRLSAEGATVVVIEQAPRLGGRATSFVDRESGERLDNGQHVVFGCYRETYALLRQIGTADQAPLQPTLSLAMAGGPDGRGHVLSCPDLPSPWHLLLGLALWDAVPLADRLAVRHLAHVLTSARRRGAEATAADVDPSITVAEWLAAHHQTTQMRRWLWDPLVFAALNQAPDDAAARPFVRVLAEMFGPRPEDAAVGLPRVPLEDLIALPAVRFLESHGGTMLTRRPAKIAVAGDRITHVKVGDTIVRAASVVSAVPWYAFPALWEEGCPPALAEIAANAASMKSAPIVTVNLWFDRDVMERGRPFVGLSDGTMHWFFGREAIVGTGTHVSAVASGAVDILRLENDDLVARAEADARRALPGTRGATLTRALVVREPRATFSLAPDAPPRPSTITPLPGFYLAGDWTDTGLPATIEGAVRSGNAAASAVQNR